MYEYGPAEASSHLNSKVFHASAPWTMSDMGLLGVQWHELVWFGCSYMKSSTSDQIQLQWQSSSWSVYMRCHMHLYADDAGGSYHARPLKMFTSCMAARHGFEGHQ